MSEHAWALWLAAAALLGVAEMFSLDLVFAMLAVGCVVGMVAALAGAPFLLALVLAGATSAATLFLLRPPLIARLHTGPELRQGHDKLIGREGVVTQLITGLEVGRIRLAGEEWSAAPYDDTLRIEPGQTVEVLQIKGATAYVHPIPQLEE